jgi:AcrR family transcriptional regulator
VRPTQEEFPQLGGPITLGERRALLLDAAETVFLDRGFRSATMDGVARRAGMSKKTVYRLFVGKQALFEALLKDRFRNAPMTVEDDDRPLRAVLVDVLCRSVRHILTSRQIALLRLVVARAPGKQSPMEQAVALASGSNPLERWLAEKAAAGRLAVEDPAAAAAWLLWGAAGKFVINSLLTGGFAPTAEEIAAQVNWVVGVFLSDSCAGEHAFLSRRDGA